MNDQVSNLFTALKSTDVGTKVIIAISSVAMIAALAIVGVVSKDTHYEATFTNLSDAEKVEVCNALATAGIDFRPTSGEGTNIVSVPSDQVSRALEAAYGGDAFQGLTKGILGSSSGSSSVFAAQAEREQFTREKDMSEIEKLIETLDFITKAEIYMKASQGNALRAPQQQSVSLVVTTKGRVMLDATQSQAVLNTLQGSVNLPTEMLSVTDSYGNQIGGGGANGAEAIDGRALEWQRNYDRNEESRINAHLAFLFGDNKARVTVSSLFDLTQSTTYSRKAGEGVVLSEHTITSETPAGTKLKGGKDGGGVAGASSNVANNGDGWDDQDSAQLSGNGGSNLEAATATTEDKETASFIPTTDKTEIHTQPVLTRLSISLALDESLAGQVVDIENNVKAMLGFEESREDTFSAMTMAFIVPEEGEVTEGEGTNEAPAGEGLPLDMLLGHGVELLTALAFIFMLMKGLKSAKGSGTADGQPTTAGAHGAAGGTSTSGSTTPGGGPAIEISPELLARAQVDDLVKNNPEHVAQILANWVVEDRSAVKSS